MDVRPEQETAGAPPKSRHRGRILISLLAVLVFVGLAPLGSVAWKLIDINREALTTSQREYQLLLASAIAGELDTRVEGLREQVIRASRSVASAVRRRGPVQTARVRRILSDVADDRILYLRFTGLDGRVVDSGTSAILPQSLEPLFLAEFQAVMQKLEEDGARRADVSTASPPLQVAGNPPQCALIVSTPVFYHGTFRGVVSALADLQSAWESVVSRHHTGHTIFAVDRSGRAFATTRPQQVPAFTYLDDREIVGRFLSGERRSRETLPFSVKTDGGVEEYLGSYEVTQEGWGVVVQARQQQVYLPVRTMVGSTLTWALGALGLAILAAALFAGTLSRPINRLAHTSRSFASGDFSARVNVRSRNEIGELAETFNLMASEIEEYIRKLRQAAEENNELFLGTIRALAQAIDAKDPYTQGHSVRVNKYAVTVSRYLDLPEEEIRNIHVASLLHDVGKIGIDDAILKKPGALSPAEFGVMKTHPVRGASIMAPIRKMKPMLPGLRNHHERWCGGGYPDGLKGEEIPLMARIITVADTFDAMTTERPYQRAIPFRTAIQRLNELKGKVLDARVVEAFNRAYQAGEFQEEEVRNREIAAASA